jgi:hypothetical protein
VTRVERTFEYRADNTVDGEVADHPPNTITSYRLNKSYDFKRVTLTEDERLRPHTSEIFVRTRDLPGFVASFKFLKVDDLKKICAACRVRAYRKWTKDDYIYELLSSSPSSDISYTLVFKELAASRRLSNIDLLPITVADVRDNERQADRRQRSVARAANIRMNERSQTSTVQSAQEDTAFPRSLTYDDLADTICRWQDLDYRHYERGGCASCGRSFAKYALYEVHADSIDLGLLRNELLPQNLLPRDYDLRAYENAVLYSGGLKTPNSRGMLKLCTSCRSSLVDRRRQPVDSWANFQYYGLDILPDEVRNCMKRLSQFDKMLICRARASKITHLYSEKGRCSPSDPSQGFSKGNVAILPQEPSVLRDILPPNRAEIYQSMCTIFVGAFEKVTRQTLSKLRLGPVLVSKNNVRTMIEFLVTNNPWYRDHVRLSEENLNDLHDEANACVPKSIEVRAFNALPDDVLASQEGVVDEGTRVDITEQSTGCVDGGVPQDDVGTLLMEAYGYTKGDYSSSSYRLMKGYALDAVLKGKKFVQARTGTEFVDDADPGFLSKAYPHLDPWGIGGFYNPLRSPAQYISFERQLRNMLTQHSRHFVSDPNFTYVCWNILQKLENRSSLRFKTTERRKVFVTKKLREIQPALQSMIKKWERRPWLEAETDQEKRAMQVLSMVRLIPKHLKGSAGYKQYRRNEIRALMKRYGTPALFVTLTPDDYMNEIVGSIGGISEDQWYKMSEVERRQYVADHPDIASLAFNETMKKFIDVILKPKDREYGAFGKCSAYYGVVEAQGRGTLHCHFLIWLSGNPNPQLLRDRLGSDTSFKERMLRWLDSNIKCQLPDDVSVVTEPGGVALRRPRRTQPDVRFERTQKISDSDPDRYWLYYKDVINRVVREYNWHEHRETCWKHLKPWEPKIDSNCRMRIDGSTRPETIVDPETGSIYIKRLHPRISCYNELLSFCLKSNVDIKHIGSGEGAKALVFYVTDYVTKAELPVHIGLAAIQLAMNRTDAILEDMRKKENTEQKPPSLLVKVLNAIMGRVEVSHQQVMSYLVGGGDIYSSHQFETTLWNDIERYLDKPHSLVNEEEDLTMESDTADSDNETNQERETECRRLEEEERVETLSCDTDVFDGGDLPVRGEELFSIEANEDEEVTVSNHIRDYVMRPSSGPISSMCFYDFMALTYKSKRPKNSDNSNRRRCQNSVTNDVEGGNQNDIEDRSFLASHPQSRTHILRVRNCEYVPVLLGSRFPNPDAGELVKEEWCKSMMYLFVPWRTLQDLCAPEQSWSEVFKQTVFSTTHRSIMQNIHVEKECKDARDAHCRRWRERKRGERDLLANRPDIQVDIFVENEVDEDDDSDLYCETSRPDALDTDVEQSELMTALKQCGTFMSRKPISNAIGCDGRLMQDEDYEIVRMQEREITALRRLKRPSDRNTRENNVNAKRRKQIKAPKTTVNSILEEQSLEHSVITAEFPKTQEEVQLIIDKIVVEFNMDSNEEQERAFRIIANHWKNGDPEQLLMYVGGMGGTGKSHIIRATVEFFRRCGCPDELLLSAPTGCAAVLIDGYTIHALTFLPNQKGTRVPVSDLEKIWHDVRYLIIDEVSMVGATLMSDISNRIRKGRSYLGESSEKPFGGVNVIFFGDMGQLKPVCAKSLFAWENVKKLNPNLKETELGQTALCGTFLWNQLNKVVILKKNQRASKDPQFANLLARIRLGIAWDGYNEMSKEQRMDDANYKSSDYTTLKKREMRLIAQENPSEVERFRDAPIIVGRTRYRDKINELKVQQFAESIGARVNMYHSVDRCNRRELSGLIQERVWKSVGRDNKDALGRLPLVPGMRVMILENVSLVSHIVNGAEGTLVEVKYSEDAQGRRYARCAYVHVEGCGLQSPGLPKDVVPILPVRTSFVYQGRFKSYTISREQLPILPAYSYTDYKSQGRTLPVAIVDIESGYTLQNVYVMLSRCTSLDNLAIAHSFSPGKIYRKLSAEFRTEFSRLARKDKETLLAYKKKLRSQRFL